MIADIQVVADMFGVFGTMGFLLADIKQVWKLWCHPNYDTEAFSKTHFKVKIFSILCVEVMYIILSCYLSLTVSIVQLFLNLYIIKRLYQ